MALGSYKEARPWARAIAQAVQTRKMPPWFAEPAVGKFANDPSLTPEEIATIARWVDHGSPEGRGTPRTPQPPRQPIKPDAVIAMPEAFPIPSSGDIEYQYFIVPTGFTEDRWVQQVEVIPGLRDAVHHAVVYIREPGSAWLRNQPKGVAFTVPADTPDAVTTSDLLFTYTPGNSRDAFPEGMAKLIPAGSDLVFQMHYTPRKQGGADRTRVAMVFAKTPPRQRVLTLQIGNDHFQIPPGVPDQHVSAWGTLPNRAMLLSLYPHMHYRGKEFEYRITTPDGRTSTLLHVQNYDFSWQINYKLAQPLDLPAGTRIEVHAIFDNSKQNPRNPDPDAFVRFGFQSSEEMMIGFFDVAVPANIDKQQFFVRP